MGSSSSEKALHVLLVCFPGQGHINPFLRLANLLASHGLLVTFCINKTTGGQMKIPKNNLPSDNKPTIQFDFFDEGLDDEQIKVTPLDQLMTRLEETGRKALPGIIEKYSENGQPVSCLVSNPFLPWVCDVAVSLDIPSAILWMQSCACFSSYYHYHNKLARFPTENDAECDVVLPSMPVLKHDEVPSFLHPSTPYPFLATAILGQFAYLDKVFCILMETFQELEPEIIRHVSTLHNNIKPVGPLCLTGKISGGDLMEVNDDCIKWLDGKDKSSVVYISMGSVVSMDPTQREEFAYGLMNSGLPFLWVVRPGYGEGDEPDHQIIFPSGLEGRGKMVRWAPQEEVLRHPAVACFVTHCGWNSTMEAISAGKPVVTFPQWGDQVTDAKFLVDVFEVGVRMGRGATTTKLVKRDEVERCVVEATVGEKAEVLRRNAMRWMKEAEAAVAEDGSSTRSLLEFVEEVKKRNGATL
uniref:Glycosyltransferase n=1 Tax=Linum usitatissimum TaxID=4006 RepID=I2BH95_LINUS|nr:UDP-glycosyltransferase 1 [Linum usitatissimum]